jgi:hypothetical protein
MVTSGSAKLQMTLPILWDLWNARPCTPSAAPTEYTLALSSMLHCILASLVHWILHGGLYSKKSLVLDV